MKDLMTACPVERTLQVVGGRWNIFILMRLMEKTRRFAELQRAIDARVTGTITPKVLTHELKQLEAAGLVHREVYAEVPSRVEYSVTPLGRSLQPVIAALRCWGQEEAGGVGPEQDAA